MADNNIQYAVAGLDLDSSKVSLDKGSYTFALNALLSEKGFIQNEPANYLCTSFPSGYLPIGHVNFEDTNETVYFLVDSINNHSEIGLVDKFCNYSTIVNNDCLNFSIDHQIRAVYRPNSNCGRNIYWTDDFNPMRWMDIDNLPSPFDCNKLRIFPFVDHPCVLIENKIYEFGSLHTGVYYFTIQYSDINGNPKTSPYQFTNPYPIIKDPLTTGLQGDPADVPTSKAIGLLFTNLNTNFDYFNIIVVKKIDGILSQQRVITLPTSTTINYIYTGFEDAADITIDEAIEDNVQYSTAKEVVQTNKRLLWANLTGRQEANFQRYANNIQVQWVTKKLEHDNALEDYRNPYIDVYDKTLLRDEIYAIGIKLIYKDGTKSCIYHIPGRPKNHKANKAIITEAVDTYGNAVNPDGVSWDTTMVVSPGADNFDSATERWQVYNTAYSEGVAECDGVHFNGNYGQMAYWESALTYPNDPNIWNGLENTPIRHHKMPDCSLVNIFAETDGTYLLDATPSILGLRINNVIIDPVLFPDVLGYEIVIGDRTFQKSIIDKGLLFNNMLNGTIHYTNWSFNDPASHTNNGGTDDVKQDSYTAYGPRELFNKVNIGDVSELKIEKEFYGTATNIQPVTSHFTGTTAEGITFTSLSAGIAVATYNQSLDAQYTNIRRKITNIEYVPNNSFGLTDIGLFNNIYRESSTVLKTDGVISFPTIVDNSKNLVTNHLGDTMNVSSYYYSLKSSNPSLYNNIKDIKYLESPICYTPFDSTSMDCYFPGDCFISKFTFHKRITDIYAVESMDRVTTELNSSDTDFSNDTVLTAVCIMMVESDINTEYRYNGETVKEYFYPNLNHTVGTTTWLLETYLDKDNYYNYNNDYSSLNDLRVPCVATTLNIPLCSANYPTRVIYSEQQTEELLVDYYLSYLANSYFDYPKEDGEIWQSFASGDTLYVRTKINIYQHKLNFQQLETDVNNVIVGTGALFAIPPVQMAKIDNGYGGTTSQWALNLTPFGYFFLDPENGRVFNFEQGLKEISQNKLFRYFKTNLPLTLDKQVDSVYGKNTFTNFDNPANPNGIGYLSAWDNDNKRWILTKKDYSINSGKHLGPTGNLNYIDGKFYDNGRPSTQIELSNTEYFCNRSFTISYSPLTNRWMSFHSYLPFYYVTGKDTFLSVKSSDIYAHNDKCIYTTYYGDLKPFMIEITNTMDSVNTFTSPNIEWTQEQETCVNDNTVSITDMTFNKAYVYNDSNQHSGLLNLNLVNELDLSNILSLPTDNANSRTIQYSNKEGTYSFSDFEDISNYQDKQVNLNTSSCTNIDYIAAYPIDKVPDTANIDFMKAWYERERFRGSWISYRLIQDSRNDFKLTTNFFILDPKESIR